MTICQSGLFFSSCSNFLRIFALDFNGCTPLRRNREGKSKSGCRELATALFFLSILNVSNMNIKIIRDNGRNPFKNAIIAECLIERGSISIDNPFAIIEVPEWPLFCRCVLRAAASCSRDGRGSFFKGGLNVQVVHENGNCYHVHIDIDATLNGLRYGSLSR